MTNSASSLSRAIISPARIPERSSSVNGLAKRQYAREPPCADAHLTAEDEHEVAVFSTELVADCCNHFWGIELVDR